MPTLQEIIELENTVVLVNLFHYQLHSVKVQPIKNLCEFLIGQTTEESIMSIRKKINYAKKDTQLGPLLSYL